VACTLAVEVHPGEPQEVVQTEASAQGAPGGVGRHQGELEEGPRDGHLVAWALPAGDGSQREEHLGEVGSREGEHLEAGGRPLLRVRLPGGVPLCPGVFVPGASGLALRTRRGLLLLRFPAPGAAS
jgi:hypothetical protein